VWAQIREWSVKVTDAELICGGDCAANFSAFWLLGSVTHYRYRLDRAPAGFVPPGQLWYPEQVPGFGPWVEWREGMPYPFSGEIVSRLFADEREGRKFRHSGLSSDAFLVWDEDIVAYCVKLEDQPTADEIEATQKNDTMEQYHRDALEDFVEANRPMFSADEAGVKAGRWDRHNARAALSPATPAPPFMVSPMRSSDGLLTEWPVGDHRLGGWQS
jgi:hypothetical protein